MPTESQSAQFKREALPHDLDPYKRECAGCTMPEFEQKRPYPFLLYARSKLWDPGLIAAHRSGGDQTQLVSYELVQGGHTFLSPIRKRQTAASEPGIVLGRSPDMDVVVPVGSVSSMHLRFMAPVPNPSWTVIDLGSRNGTWLNEVKMTPQAVAPIRDGEYLRLGGNLIAWFLYPGRVWHLLSHPAELKKLTDL